ncbi:MAG: M20/M25/M40 family metallo-hydrolase [Chloroflexota bacterium]|nr:M20/M25/M40 family metallo-hydrolase [Chloroflexota bacterium]
MTTAATSGGQQQMDWTAIGDDAVRILQALLRFETVNLPGNETPAVTYIADLLQTAGIEAEVIEAEPGRGSVVARLRAERRTGRPLLLTGHTDVVSVEPGKWSQDPFGGEIVDGYIWGRGALDMKGQVAAELAVLLALARNNVALGRDVTFAAFADEERGGQLGAAWLWRNRPDVLDAEYAINEGGGRSILAGDQRIYLCQSGEKGPARLRITAHGPAGHASVPLDGTAMGKMSGALGRLTAWEPPTKVTTPVRILLETIAAALDEAGAAAVARVIENPTVEAIQAMPVEPLVHRIVRATTRDTAVPTVIQGGKTINVIPSEVTLGVDCRILPGTDPEAWRSLVQSVVGDEVEVELLSREPGLEFDPASPLFEIIKETIAEMAPGATVAPYLTAGATDARHIPGIKVYGFFPFAPSDRAATYAPLVHGHDERIAVADLHFATRFLYQVTTRLCGA